MFARAVLFKQEIVGLIRLRSDIRAKVVEEKLWQHKR